MTTIYLCGPINGCTDEECKDWREYVKSIWKGKTLDPMRRDYRGRETECAKEIVEGDKEDITASDVILVNYVKPSVGTSMEVYLAFTTGRLVIVVAEKGKILSPWLLYHSHRVFHSFAEAISFIEEEENAPDSMLRRHYSSC